jgi:hypothetical protein
MKENAIRPNSLSFEFISNYRIVILDIFKNANSQISSIFLGFSILFNAVKVKTYKPIHFKIEFDSMENSWRVSIESVPSLINSTDQKRKKETLLFAMLLIQSPWVLICFGIE